MYQFQSPSGLILNKSGFEQWCTKINTFSQLVSPTARQQSKKLTSARNNSLLLSNDTLPSDQKPTEDLLQNKFQTSKIGGNKLWQISTKNFQRSRPSIQFNTVQHRPSQPSSPKLSSQFDFDTRLRQIVKFMKPKEKPATSLTHKRLPSHTTTGTGLCSDHQHQRREGALDQRRQTTQAVDPVSIEIKGLAQHKQPRKIVVTEKKLFKTNLSEETEHCQSLQEVSQNSPSAKITVLQTFNEQHGPQKERGSVITQTQSQLEQSQDNSPQFKKLVQPIQEMRHFSKRKPETSQHRTRIKLQTMRSGQSAQYELKVTKQAMSLQDFAKRSKQRVDALQPQHFQHRQVINEDLQVKPLNDDKTQKRQKSHFINRVLVRNKMFSIDARVTAKQTCTSGFDNTRIPPINPRFSKQRPVLYPTTGQDYQPAMMLSPTQ